MATEARPLPRDVHVAIVGAGFGGIGAAVRLRAAGIDDVVVLERSDRLGGTWRENTYPGCACDVPAHLYSFSFAPNPGWSRMFAPQAEILAYLERTAREHPVERRLERERERPVARQRGHDPPAASGIHPDRDGTLVTEC